MGEVELNISNYTKCLCPVCPVQSESGCIAARKSSWVEARKGAGRILKQYHLHPETYEMEMGSLQENEVGKEQGFRKPEPEEMMELYCSNMVGKSSCSDLDDDQVCQCPSCAVWSSHDLSGLYYCL